MQQFRLTKQIGDTKAITLNTFYSFEECYVELLHRIGLEEECKKKFYVLNDFYENKHDISTKNIIKFCIETRNVSDWGEYKQVVQEEKSNKIIKFQMVR